MFDLQGFELFLHIADMGSITRTAEKLGVTKAWISRQLKALELALRVDLFTRTKQRLELTETGKILLEQCRRLQKELEDTRALCQSLHGEPEGKLHVVALDFFAKKLIYPRLPQFLDRYPKIELFIDTNERFPNFYQEQVDIAVGFTLPMPPDITQRRLTDFRYVMAASKEYFKKYGHPQKLSDLVNHRYIGHKVREEVRITNLKSPHRCQINPYLILNNVASMISCAKAGLGIIQLPSYMLDPYLEDQSLVETLREYQEDKAKVFCYYPKFRYTQPKVRKFLDFLYEEN